MKCTACGAQLDKGSLYCNVCGKEVMIVPDFDPELEDATMSTIASIAEDIFSKDDTSDSTKATEKSDTNSAKDKIEDPITGETKPLPEIKKRYGNISSDKLPEFVRKDLSRGKKSIIFLSACILALLLMVGLVIHATYVNSESYLLKNARQSANLKDYEKAELLYERLMNADSENSTYVYELALVYHQDGELVLCENLLLQLIAMSSASTEQIVSSYGVLVGIYEGLGDYQSIHDLLRGCIYSEVVNTYRDFVGDSPSFSLESGTYKTQQQLLMLCKSTQTIYYTLDGTMPTTESTRYRSPLFLAEGAYSFKAYAVEDSGVCSDIVSLSIVISPQPPVAPEIVPAAGNYDTPQMIEVNDFEEGGTVYYTRDGSKPTIYSFKYKGPISMPEGVSDFSFARFGSNGQSSKVVSRHYILNLPEETQIAMPEGEQPPEGGTEWNDDWSENQGSEEESANGQESEPQQDAGNEENASSQETERDNSAGNV